MKKTKRFLTSLLLAFAMVALFLPTVKAESGVYAGGPVYYGRNYSINELRNSGFTFVVVWTIHISSSGELNFNAEFPLVNNGSYIGGSSYPNFKSDIGKLKDSPSSIKRIEFALSAWGSSTFDNIRNLVNSQGTGPGSILYRNFQALRNNFPDVDAINFDDESTYHLSSATQFAVMLSDLGFKVTLCPYTQSNFWKNLATNVNNQRPGTIDRVLLQCYAGGSSNSPCTWDNYFSSSIKVFPGIWTHTPSTIQSKLGGWKNQCGIQGGWLWLYDEFDNNLSRVQAAASAINGVFDGGSGGSTYIIKNRYTGKVLRVKNGGTANNTQVVLWDEVSWSSTRFEMIDLGNGYYNIKNEKSGKLLRPYNANSADNTNVIIYSQQNWQSQQWQLINAGSGYYLIKNRYTGKCLRPYNAQSANNTNVVIYTQNSSWQSQHWKFISTSSLKSSPTESINIAERSENILEFNPNPATHYIEIVNADELVKYRIINMSGQTVLENTGNIVDVSGLKPGLYVIKTGTNGYGKFIKQ